MFTSILTERLDIWCIGCEKVAILGLVKSAISMPSKPTTEISYGTRFPISRNALTAPTAIISDIANTADISLQR